MIQHTSEAQAPKSSRRGRPPLPAERKRVHRFNLRVTRAELDAIYLAAIRHRVDATCLVRAVIRQFLVRPGDLDAGNELSVAAEHLQTRPPEPTATRIKITCPNSTG